MPRSFLGRLATVIKLCSLLWRWYCMDQFYPQLYLALYRTRDQAPGLMGQQALDPSSPTRMASKGDRPSTHIKRP